MTTIDELNKNIVLVAGLAASIQFYRNSPWNPKEVTNLSLATRDTFAKLDKELQGFYSNSFFDLEPKRSGSARISGNLVYKVKKGEKSAETHLRFREGCKQLRKTCHEIVTEMQQRRKQLLVAVN